MTIRRRRRDRTLRVLIALGALALVVVELAGVGSGALHVGPALALFVLFAVGRYPGERLISRPLARARARRRIAPTLAAPRSRPRAARMRGREIAMAMAERGPPRRPSVST